MKKPIRFVEVNQQMTGHVKIIIARGYARGKNMRLYGVSTRRELVVNKYTHTPAHAERRFQRGMRLLAAFHQRITEQQP